MDGLMSDDADDIVKEGVDAFERCKDAESENRATALEDLRFARLGEQWPSEIKAQRLRESRPVLTINRMGAFIRQVVNDARQNKPQINVRPVDNSGDYKTADVISGLIRNIEHVSSADVAYDTAVECATSAGFGFIRVSLDYASDDVFAMDLGIERVANPFSIYGDPDATSVDGSDWNVAFVTDRVSRDVFKRKYKGKAEVDFDGAGWQSAKSDWLNSDGVMIAEWWSREEYDRAIVRMTDGRVFGKDQLETDPDLQIALQVGALTVNAERIAKSNRVRQRIISGLDVLEDNQWPGRYIPIIPVYGDEFSVEGKRYYRSLINQAKDAQRMLNYWRTTATELTALAPRVPFIGPKGAFKSDAERWNTANTRSHSYLEYDGAVPPQRQPLDVGAAAGALQEALNASDDIKSIMGIYDASLGARSNETSGRAIMARQREGDVSTFHFIDNLARSIRQVGRVLVDLIPHVYDKPRIIRVLGVDGKEETVPVNQRYQAPVESPSGETTDQTITAIHDLTAGKYDVAVEAGPSFTTRREEAAAQMTELVRAFPAAAPYVGDIMARNFDWPGADEIAKRLEMLNPAKKQQLPPEIMQQIESGKAKMAELQAENEKLKQDRAADFAKIEADKQIAYAKIEADREIERAKLAIKTMASTPLI